MFNAAEAAACRRLVDLALREDLGDKGDLTSQAVVPADSMGRAAIVARTEGVLAGLPAVAMVLETVDPRLQMTELAADGDRLQPGQHVAALSGPTRSLLAAERVLLNFLQRLSGVATLTRRYVEAVVGFPAKVLDTRKTTPGWRLLEKYAVRCGGGHNHRLGLDDAILIKDNHLAAAGKDRNSIEETVQAARGYCGAGIPVEIEVDSLEQLDRALACRPEIVLLDNFSPEWMREAVRRRDAAAPGVQLEASGGITLATIRAFAETGVERISVGALTHSAPALDLALDFVSS